MAKKVTAKVPTRFTEFLTSTGDNSLLKRADIIERGVVLAANTKVQEIQNTINEIEMRIARREDLGIRTTDSLTPAEIDTNKWYAEMFDDHMKLELAQVDLRIAEQIQEKYLSPIENTEESE